MKYKRLRWLGHVLGIEHSGISKECLKWNPILVNVNPAGATDVSGEEKLRMVSSGSRTIYRGSLQQEDKVIKLWEVARVGAKDTIFDGIFMWWPVELEIKAEDFNTINFFKAGLCDAGKLV